MLCAVKESYLKPMIHLLQLVEPGQTQDPHTADSNFAVGVDLGTTNSVIAISRQGKANVLENKEGQYLVPSLVAYDPKQGVTIGHKAREILLKDPMNVVSSVKRLMGRGIEDLASEQQDLLGLSFVKSAASNRVVQFEVAGR